MAVVLESDMDDLSGSIRLNRGLSQLRVNFTQQGTLKREKQGLRRNGLDHGVQRLS